MRTIGIFVAAAVCEIAGCFAFWAVLRHHAPWPWLIAGVGALVAFAGLLTLVDVSHAGRAYAIYGGIYIAATLLWLWGIEGHIPDRWDIIGASVAIAGALIIAFGPRS